MLDYDGNATTYTYTDTGQLSTLTTPGENSSFKTWDFDYNALGQRTQVLAPNDVTTTYGYDQQNRLVQIQHLNGQTLLDGYHYYLDNAGNIVWNIQNDPDYTYWYYEYDQRYRLTQAYRFNSLPWLTTITAAYEYAYDAADNLVTKVEPFKDDFNDGNFDGWSAWSSTWDASNHYLTRTGGTGGITLDNEAADNYERWFTYYNADTSDPTQGAQISLRDSGNDSIALYIKGDSLMLQQCYQGNYSNLDLNSTETTQDTWYDCHVVCDGSTIEVWREETGTGDGMELLLSTSTAAVPTSSVFYFQPTPDSSVRFDDVRLVSDDVSTTTALCYDAGNELTKTTSNNVDTVYTYDLWGRRIVKAMQTHAAVYQYAYGDKLSHITSWFPDEIYSSEFVYDGLGKLRRIDQFNGDTIAWLRWDAGWNLLGLYAAGADPNTTWDIAATQGAGFIHDPSRVGGNTLAFTLGEPSGGFNAYLSQDNLGSNRRLRWGDQSSMGEYEYGPYGDEYQFSDGEPPMFGYTGHALTIDNLYYAPYRWYDPATAGWMTRDPIGHAGGMNLYGYVNGQPTGMTDPMGDFAAECALAGSAAPGIGNLIGLAIGVLIDIGIVLIVLDMAKRTPQRSPFPPADRDRSRSKKEAREKAEKAGKGADPIHHPNGHPGDPRPHYHPNVPENGKNTPHAPNKHDHYYYPQGCSSLPPGMMT